MMRRNRWIAALLAACLLALPACTGRGDSAPSEPAAEQQSGEEIVPAGGVIPGLDVQNYPRVDGSTANMPMMARIYSEVCGVPLSEAESAVYSSEGTGAVWRNMMYEGADLLLVYEAPETVKAEMEEQGLELDIQPIGRDGLVFLVNSKNKVDSLTREQLVDIYTGKTTDWSEVGGDAGPIAPYQRNEESGSQTLFRKLLMQDTEPMVPAKELVPGMMGALIDAVAAFDGSGGAIGYSVYYYASLMYENPDLKLLAVDGVAPSGESIGDGSYPLCNEFYVVIRADEPEGSPARLLRDWLLTDAGAKIMEESGYVVIG